jgi:isopenicillin N synthase-like dioxygenase
MKSTSLPVIDLSQFMANPASTGGRACVEQLREACHGPGFCYIAGHGVPSDLDAAIMRRAAEFFALPAAERHALAIANSPHFRGYTVLGDERTRGVSDWREQLDVGPEEPAEAVARDDPPWRRLRGPNQWPESLPAMRTTVIEWMQTMDRVGLVVLRALAVGLGQPIDHFDSVVLPRGDPHLKIMRYPAQPQAARLDQGVGLHHDSGLVSFVLQDGVGGLQVLLDGELIDVEARPGTYVMNLGEMLQAATSGYLKATPHRVRSPAPGRERISVAYFFHPRLDARFDPIELPAALKRRTRSGQNADPSDPVFSTFGDNYLKIRLRSHPDVARAHYAGLLERLSGGSLPDQPAPGEPSPSYSR